MIYSQYSTQWCTIFQNVNSYANILSIMICNILNCQIFCKLIITVNCTSQISYKNLGPIKTVQYRNTILKQNAWLKNLITITG